MTLKIDLDALTMAFEYPSDESAYFLNTQTGALEFIPFDPSSEVWAELGIESLDDLPDYFLHVEPIDSGAGFDMMADFVETVRDAELADELAEALSRKHPFRRFKDVLLAYPSERECWFQYRDACLQELAQEWLDANNIQAELVNPRQSKSN